MTIKVTMPNGVQIEGETKEELKAIFDFVAEETSPKIEKDVITLMPLQFKTFCIISDSPGVHSGQVALALDINKGKAASIIRSLKDLGLVERRTDGHWGWIITDYAKEGVEIMSQEELGL